MALYGKHHVVLYGIASCADTTVPKQNFFSKRFIDERTSARVRHDKENKRIPTYHPMMEIEEDVDKGLILPYCLDGHFVNNGQSLLAFSNNDSKVFSLQNFFLAGNTIQKKTTKEFVLNNYYDAILFSSDQRFCLLLDDVKDQTRLHRKLHISYITFKCNNQLKPSHGQLHRNVHTLKYTSSFALIKQHKYTMSPNNKYLAVASFTNNQSNLDLIRIDRIGNHTLTLTEVKKMDLREHFTFTYLQLMKFNTDGTKILLVATRTLKQNQVVLFSTATQCLYSIKFLCPTKKNDTCHYFFVPDYRYGEILVRVSSSGIVELVKINNYTQKSLKHFQVSESGITKQILSCDISSYFKYTTLYLGVTGEIFVLNLHTEQTIAKISMDDDKFRISSLFVNWCQNEVFALRESNSCEPGKIKITHLKQSVVSSLEELSAKAVLQTYPIQKLKKMNIPTTLYYIMK